MSKKYVLEQISQKAKTVAPKDAVIYLYGSRARGDERPDSDWDILILLDKDRITLQDLDDVAYPIRELGWDLNEDVNPLLFTKKEWAENHFTPFNQEVTKDAVMI